MFSLHGEVCVGNRLAKVLGPEAAVVRALRPPSVLMPVHSPLSSRLLAMTTYVRDTCRRSICHHLGVSAVASNAMPRCVCSPRQVLALCVLWAGSVHRQVVSCTTKSNTQNPRLQESKRQFCPIRRLLSAVNSMHCSVCGHPQETPLRRWVYTCLLYLTYIYT